MKKSLLLSALIACGLPFTASAAFEAPSVTNISSTQISISGTTDESCVGKNISAVILYPNEPEYKLSDLGSLSDMNDNDAKALILEKICDVKQAKILSSEDGGKYSFSVTLDENSISGKYVVKLAVLGEKQSEEDTTYYFDYYSKSYKDGLVLTVNGAGEISDDILADIAKVLNIEISDIPEKTDKIKKLLLANRGEGYETFDDIANEWNRAVFLYDTEKGNISEEDFYETLKGYGIDTAEYENFFEQIKEKAAKSEINTIDELISIMHECKIIEDIKAADRETIESVMDKYKDNIFNTESLKSSYTKYKNLSDEKKMMVNAAIGTENETVEALRVNFEKGMKTALSSSSTSSTSSGASKPGGSGGKNNYVGTVNSVTPDSVQKTEKIGFSDIEQVDWAKEAVEAFESLGFVSGGGDGKFYPENKITRAEFIKMLVNVFDIYDGAAPCYAPDAPESAWYGQFVASAQKAEVLMGDENGNVLPDKNITREDIAVLIYRTAKKAGIEFGGKTKEFSDWDDISDYAQEAVEKLSASGIINGMGNNEFKPLENSTRAEAVTMLYRIWKLL